MALYNFTKTVMSNLFHKPATILYPTVPIKFKERTRGHISIDIDQCIFCGMCQRRCPPGAITVVKDELGWSINPFDCIQCNSCVEVCPKKCLYMNNSYTVPAGTKVRDEFHKTDVKVAIGDADARIS